jgi:hypothetical protein
MIPIEHIKTSGPVKLGHQPEGITVGLNDRIDTSVLPEFITVSQFDISISSFIIIGQSGEEQVLVIQKII